MGVEIPVSIDIIVTCESCGATLEVFSYTKSNVVELEVVPCSHCLKIAEEGGYSNGLDESDRYDLGYEVGRAEGAQEALEEYIMDGGRVP